MEGEYCRSSELVLVALQIYKVAEVIDEVDFKL